MGIGLGEVKHRLGVGLGQRLASQARLVKARAKDLGLWAYPEMVEEPVPVISCSKSPSTGLSLGVIQG